MQRRSTPYIPKALLVAALLAIWNLGLSTSIAGAETPGPVAAYSFDEGSGTTVHDLAGSPDNGTLEAGTAWVAEGRYGGALQFDGVDDRVRIADADRLDLTGSFTVEGWVKPDSLSGTKPLLSKFGTSPLNGYSLTAAAQGSGLPDASIANAGSLKTATALSALSTGEWAHLAATFDGAKLRLYVNGVEATSTSAGPAGASTADLLIGRIGFAGASFDGLIDEVRLFNRALDQTEIEVSQERPINPSLMKDILRHRRHGSAYNANFDHDGIDDYRVDADIATFSSGAWKDGVPNPQSETLHFDLAHRTDCVNPDPYREALGEYELPDIENTTPHPEDPFWVPNSTLNEEYESSYYGCLENSGAPLSGQAGPSALPLGNAAAMFEGNLSKDESNKFIDQLSMGGTAPGARIWSVRTLPISYIFGVYPAPYTYPVELHGKGLQPVSSPSIPLACGTTQFEAPTSFGTNRRTVQGIIPEYGGCTTTDQAKSPVAVRMNSCTYTLKVINIDEPYEGTLDIACAEKGDEIEIDVYAPGEKEVICTETIPPQSGLKGMVLTNVGTGIGRGIQIDAALQGIKYELSGPCVEAPLKKGDGELKAKADLYGDNQLEEPVGIFLRGVEVVDPGGEGMLSPRIADETDWLPEYGASAFISGLDWVIATKQDEDPTNDIDAVTLISGCHRQGDPLVEEAGFGDLACDSTVFDAKVREAMDHGIVVVQAAGEFERDVKTLTPPSVPDVLTVTVVTDADDQPGGKAVGSDGKPIASDDRGWWSSNFGLAADITFAGGPIDSGTTSPAIAGAVAALASQCPAHDRAGAEYIVDTLMAEGDTGEIALGGWEDISGDGWKEPLLNLRDEEVFDPVLIDTETGQRNHQPDEDGCPWRSHQAESDVGSDGRADLVAIDAQSKRAEVSAGAYEGPEDQPGKAGYQTAAQNISLTGQLDPALLDGKGRYLIDSADVSGDRRADLIAAGSGEGIYVYPGNAQGGFGAAVESLKGITLRFAKGGAGEPIAVADVNGDGRADLVAHSGTAILTFPGQANGSFGAAVDSGLSVDSALLDRTGNYFLDVIDVTGEELDAKEPIDYNARHSYADLVTMNTDGSVYVFKGQASGKFAAPLSAAQINPIFDDGIGAEPVGLGDIDRDRRADLVALEGETLKLYEADLNLETKAFSFKEAPKPYAANIDSSLLDGKGEELIGLLDYSRDGLADLVSVKADGTVLTYTAQRDRTFAAPKAQAGTLPSLRTSATGHEFTAEKPILRRAGCVPGGCDWPSETFASSGNPVAAYSFNEGSGTTLKDSAGAHHGTIEGGATWTTAGRYGSALDFDGTNDLVSIADANALDLTGSFTIEAWVKPDTFAANRPVISKLSGATGSFAGYLLSTNPTSAKPRGYVANTGTIKLVEGPSALATSPSWSHLAFTSDGTTLRLYVNGQLANTAPAITAQGNTNPLRLGRDGVTGGWFDGLIDEVRIYDVPLSEGQIQVDSDSPVDPKPIAAYSFNEGSGTTLKDSAGAHTGTIEGATWTAAGRYGSALNFDGTDDLVSIADANDLDLTGAFTIEAWVRPDVLGGTLFSKTESPTGSAGYLVNLQSNGKPRGYVANSGTLKSAESEKALTTGSWAHLAFTSDGANLKIYVDGQLKGLATGLAAKASLAKLELGHNQLFNLFFDGLIDEVRIYGVPLSQAQIEADRAAAL